MSLQIGWFIINVMKNHNARGRIGNLSQDKQDLITPRDKKINDLSLVLEKQKKTIQKLLSQQRDKDGKCSRKNIEIETHVKEVNCPKDIKIKKEVVTPSKYQQICNQIVDIGNRVLTSHRKNHHPQTMRESPTKAIEKSVQKLNVTDKQLQYLQSQQYRLYLQNITQQAQSAQEIIKKMREVRNNNIYTQHRANGVDQMNQRSERNVSQIRKNEEILEHQTKKRYYPLKYYPENKITYRRDLTPRQYNRQVIASNQINIKQMAHSPTMKDIQKSIQPHNDNKVKNQEIVKSKSCNKLQSKTIQYTIQSQLKQCQSKYKKPLLRQSFIDNASQIEYVTPIKQNKKKYIKDWNFDVIKIHHPIYSHSQANKKYYQYGQKIISTKSSKQQTRNINYEQILYYERGRQIRQKNRKINKKQQKKIATNPYFKLQQNQFQQKSNPFQNILKQTNIYPLQFKLKNPDQKHTKTKTGSFQNQSQWNTIILQSPHHYQPTKNQIKINPNFSNIHSIKKQKTQEYNKENYKQPIDLFKQLDQSSVTSAVTRALENQYKGHSRSPSKLTIITPSKRQKK